MFWWSLKSSSHHTWDSKCATGTDHKGALAVGKVEVSKDGKWEEGSLTSEDVSAYFSPLGTDSRFPESLLLAKLPERDRTGIS